VIVFGPLDDDALLEELVAAVVEVTVELEVDEDELLVDALETEEELIEEVGVDVEDAEELEDTELVLVEVDVVVDFELSAT
jgi:hypothetical protein